MADEVDHRKLGTEYFNAAWELLDKQDRSQEEDDEMIHTAHASRFHWGKIGDAVNFLRGEWQIGRVYSVLERGEPALYHSMRCLELCEENNIGDFDLAYAYEGLARAFAVSGERKSAEKYLALARQAGQQINEKEDRELFFKDLDTVEV